MAPRSAEPGGARGYLLNSREPSSAYPPIQPPGAPERSQHHVIATIFGKFTSLPAHNPWASLEPDEEVYWSKHLREGRATQLQHFCNGLHRLCGALLRPGILNGPRASEKAKSRMSSVEVDGIPELQAESDPVLIDIELRRRRSPRALLEKRVPAEDAREGSNLIRRCEI